MLDNLSILVTRPVETSEILASALRLKGGLPVVTPMIEIVGIETSYVNPIDKDFDCAVFVSRNAVHFGLSLLKEREISLEQKTILAIGPRTAEALIDAGIKKPIFPDGTFNSEGLIESPDFKLIVCDKKRVLVFRAKQGREFLAKTLRQNGCRVDYCECYAREMSQKKIGTSLNEAGIEAPDVILITSGAILEALTTKISQENLLGLLDIQTLVLGDRLVGKVTEAGFTVPPLVVQQLTNDTIISCLLDWVKIRNSSLIR